MKKLLELCIFEKNIIEVYLSFYDLSNYFIGYVDTINGETVVFKIISDDGLYLGSKILMINDILMIDTNKKKSKKNAFLLENFHACYNQHFTFKNSIIDILLYAKNEKIILNIYTASDCITCMIKEVSKGVATIELVDDYGSCITTTNITIMSIKSIEYGSKMLQILQFLNKSFKF